MFHPKVIQCPFCDFNILVDGVSTTNAAKGTELVLDHIFKKHPDRYAYSPRPGEIVEGDPVDFSNPERVSKKMKVKKNVSVSLTVNVNTDEEADTAFKKMTILASRLGFEDGLNFSLTVNTWSNDEASDSSDNKVSTNTEFDNDGMMVIENLRYDEETMRKFSSALFSAGCDQNMIDDAIVNIQNKGILLRERAR